MLKREGGARSASLIHGHDKKALEKAIKDLNWYIRVRK